MRSQRTIRIVDDDRDIRESLRDLLEEHGFAVLCAEHGERALELLRGAASLPVLILLDVAMPVMDGYAFRAAQLADPAIAGVPIVVMTADGQLEDKRTRLRCEHVLRKPMTVQELLAIVAACS